MADVSPLGLPPLQVLRRHSTLRPESLMRASTIIFRCAADDCDQETEVNFTFQADILDVESSSWHLPEGWSEYQYEETSLSKSDYVVCCPQHEIEKRPRIVRKGA
jgi:hypothetical protein